MIIDSLPYLLKLIKSNVIISSILATGSFTHVELKNVHYEIISKDAIEFDNYLLSSSDSFDQISFCKIKGFSGKANETTMILTLTTKDPKYFENSKFYFNDEENKVINKHPLMKERRKTTKNFGFFRLISNQVPADVSIKYNPSYGYMITLIFYPNYKEIINNKIKLNKALENDSLK